MKRIATPIVILLLVVTVQALIAEDGGKDQKRPVYALDNSGWPTTPPEFLPALGDWARITRLSDSVKIEARVSGLDPQTVYNVHTWVFNNPEACAAAPPAVALESLCAPLIDQWNPETESSLISYGGFIPDSSGNLHLELDLRISEGLPPVGFFGTNGSFTNVVLGPGLTSPMGAEVQLDLARKGPVQPDNTQEQFQTMFGACGPDFALPPLDPSQLCELVRESRVGGKF